MREMETDYLVVGAGATGMAFVDALVAETDVEVLLVDRRPGPGGHWRDAYPFVRLHQPSALYGVDSLELGENRIETSGPNTGFYELATGAQVRDYYDRVLDEVLLPTGRVRFLGRHEYDGSDASGEHLTSLEDGERVTVRVRRRVVDATYIESSIPATHSPAYAVDADVTLVTPNGLVDLAEDPTGYTVIGGGKTSMDTCTWLLEQGVDPDRIRWVRPRDGWFFNRAHMQPLDLVGSYMYMQARWVEAAARAVSGADFAHRLEEADVFIRVDREVEPLMHRGATISVGEIEDLATIRNVVRQGKVRRISTTQVELDGGTLDSDPRHVYVDCTAEGVPHTQRRPVFEPGRITPQYVTPGYASWSAATIAKIEALRDDDRERNRLSPVVEFTGNTADLMGFAHVSLSGLSLRGAEPDLAAWNDRSRLNPTRGVIEHVDDPRVVEAFASFGTNLGPAAVNLERLAGAGL